MARSSACLVTARAACVGEPLAAQSFGPAYVKMATWQTLRLDRARQQELVVTHVECADTSLIFCVQGVSDEYLVEVEQDADMWPPRCSCEDNYWRPVLCKHVLLCLKLMGFCNTDLEGYGWEGPEQQSL